MFSLIKNTLDTACKAYPPIAFGICTHTIVSEGLYIYKNQQDSRKTERMHTMLNSGIALSALAAIYLSPGLSDFLNGSYYVSRYQADFYASNKGNYKQIWRGFFIFAAAASFGLAASGAMSLPWTAFLATRIAGRVLSTIETGIFLSAVAGATRPTLKYLAHPFMPQIPNGKDIKVI